MRIKKQILKKNEPQKSKLQKQSVKVKEIHKESCNNKSSCSSCCLSKETEDILREAFSYENFGKNFEVLNDLYDTKTYQQNFKKPHKAKHKRESIIQSLILDGSNICCWTNNERKGNLLILFTLINEIIKLKIHFHIFFDANIRFILHSDTESEETLSHAFKAFLSLIHDKITIVPARNRADDFILQKADRDGAHIISNDTYKEYLDKYPWLAKGDRVLGGTIIDNRLSIPLLRIDPIVTKYAFEGIELIKNSIYHSKYSTRNSQQQQSSVSI